MRRGLERELVGAQITEIRVSNPKVLQGQDPAEFAQRLAQKRIAGVNRRGKYLLLPLTSDTDFAIASPDCAALPDPRAALPPLTLCIHLKMRGLLFVEETAKADRPYHCVSILFGQQRELRYHDAWGWGEVRALTDTEQQELLPALSKMGPEPLSDTWNAGSLKERVGRRRVPIKSALLDQSVVAGVGNIYADESLYRAGIHPERSALSLSDEEWERIVAGVRCVLREAVRAGGTMSEEFFDAGGQPGRYQPLVYGRGGQECRGCSAALIRTRLNGRGTVYCPVCQK